jgi:hypothetical protein
MVGISIGEGYENAIRFFRQHRIQLDRVGNIYGDAATEDMRRANSKVVQMVLRTGAKAVNGL